MGTHISPLIYFIGLLLASQSSFNQYSIKIDLILIHYEAFIIYRLVHASWCSISSEVSLIKEELILY
jgi:hypothetical protein